MPANILTTGSTAADSSDFPVAVGTPVTVGIKGAVDAKARVRIRLKDDIGGYTDVGELTPSRPVVAIIAPGTYLFTREAGSACGVFSA